MFETEIQLLKTTAEKLFQDKNILAAIAPPVQTQKIPLKHQLEQTLSERESPRYEIEKIERQLSSVDGDIQMYNRRLTHQDNEYLKWKQFSAHIQRLLVQAKNEIHNEILARNSCEKTATQLRIDLSRLLEQQRKSVGDLKKSSFMLNLNSSNERALTFKSELSNAIRSIRQDCDKQNDSLRNELYEKFKQSYDHIIQQNPEVAFLFSSEAEKQRIRQEEQRTRMDILQIQSDADSLKQKNSDLRLRSRELQIKLEMSQEENRCFARAQDDLLNHWRTKYEQMTRDYEDVILKQSSLENEIETYRNLLEGAMKPVVDQITDNYNLMLAKNEKKSQQQNNLANLKSLSLSADQLLSLPSHQENIDENHSSYVSSLVVNLNNNLSKSLPNDSILLKQNGSIANKNVGSFYLAPIDINEASTEGKEKTNEGPLPNIRKPILIETRRKK